MAKTPATKQKHAAPKTDDVVTGSQADYDAHLAAAKRIPASAIIPMRADPQLALHNVQIGVACVLAEAARVSKLPETDVKALSSLPQIALAVTFASTQLAPSGATIGLATLVARGRSLRALLLKTADALVESALFPKAEVDKIRAGHGKLDAARDLRSRRPLACRRVPPRKERGGREGPVAPGGSRRAAEEGGPRRARQCREAQVGDRRNDLKNWAASSS